MTSVVVNPVWNVPESIVDEELIPALATDPGHLQRKRIRVYAGRGPDAPEIDAASSEWRRVMDAPAQYSFRQDPGDGNALGRFKFLLPNQFDVYLHDTPAGNLFRREERSFSHGCIRVAEPVRLAAYVLRGRPEADPETLEQLAASGETRTLTLPESLPVHILYFTAFVDDDGRVQFRDDVYGIDRELDAKLAGR
jgi:murein L,D-transpeptidase YcbB/YkuD